jgi:5-methylcytosine-specific restriction protein A
MPKAALRPCAQPGCSAVVEAGRCSAHARQQDTARGTAQQRGYTYRWSQYSQVWLTVHPFCGERADGTMHAEHSRCWQEGRLVAAECTDHIIPVSRGGDFWHPSNHQSLCIPCNSAKGDK